MQAPLFLPSPVRSLVNWLFFSLLNEGDDFTQILRKVVTTIMLLCTPISLGAGAFGFFLIAKGAQRYGPHIFSANAVICTVLLIANYTYLRSKRSVSATHADATFVCLTLSCVVGYLCVPDFDARPLAGAAATLSTLAQPRKLWLCLVIHFALSAVSIYNQVYRYSGKTLLLFPGPIRPSGTLDVLILQLMPLFALVLAVFSVVMQAAAHVRALESSENGVRMSNEVVELLADYNTDGVDEVLTAYAAKREVNSSLIQSFRGINKNLELYRPHLPNYVLMRDEEPEAVRRPNSRHSDGNSTSRSDSSHCGLQDGRLSTTKSDSLANSGMTFHGRISFARVDLSGMLVNGSLVRDASAAFFDLLFQLASTFLASVHATVGDVAILSWNATHRVAQPEMKAAKFLLRLMNATKSLPCAHPVSGAVFTGTALCDVVTAAAAKQQAVLISAPWASALDVAFRLARSTRCGLIDAETNATAALEIETRAVDSLRNVSDQFAESEFCQVLPCSMFDDTASRPQTDLPPAKSRLLYELVVEFQRSDDEWMYQLQQSATEHTASAVVTKALLAAVDGDFGTAMSFLTSPPLEALLEDSRIVRRLKIRCERQLLTKPARLGL